MKWQNKQILLFLIIVVTNLGGLYAQHLSLEDRLLTPNALLQGELGSGTNTIYQKTEGDNNALTINQANQFGQRENLIRTLQVGDKNKAYIRQTGAGNELALIQHGTNNTYYLGQSGLNNQTVAVQDGNNNTIYQQSNHANNVYSEFVQKGNNNQIIHLTTGMSGQNFTIRQNGNGLNATVLQSIRF